MTGITLELVAAILSIFGALVATSKLFIYYFMDRKNTPNIKIVLKSKRMIELSVKRKELEEVIKFNNDLIIQNKHYQDMLVAPISDEELVIREKLDIASSELTNIDEEIRKLKINGDDFVELRISDSKEINQENIEELVSNLSFSNSFEDPQSISNESK